MKKRAAPRFLDHLLVSTWTFLALFVAIALLYLAVPPRWRDRVSTEAGVWVSVAALSLLSTTRWLCYWEATQWAGVPVYALAVASVVWRSAESASPLNRFAVVSFAGWCVMAVAVPLVQRFGLRLKLRWGKGPAWQRRQVARKHVLRTLEDDGKVD